MVNRWHGPGWTFSGEKVRTRRVRHRQPFQARRQPLPRLPPAQRKSRTLCWVLPVAAIASSTISGDLTHQPHT